MFRRLCWGILLVLFLGGLVSPLWAENFFPPISVRGDKIFAGEEELLLVSVGYVYVRPGQGEQDPVPYKEFGYDLVDLDMKRIKEAGFNSIRTWHLPDKKLLELAEKHGLWVVGGIWTNTRIDPMNEDQMEGEIARVKTLAQEYAQFPNVAMLLILNEPDYAGLISQDPQKVKNYFDRLVETARSACPGVPVSFSNWPNAGFIDSSSWDVISFNLYARMPKFEHSIGYRGYVDGMKKAKAAGKPFYVSEYGFYTPSPHLQSKDMFGFYYVESPEKQAELLLRDMDTLYQLSIAGGALMSWIDNWALTSEFSSPDIQRPPGWVDKNTHDNDCIEWSGILSLDGDIRGVARPAYTALSRANQAILTEPDSEALYSGEIPVSVYLGDKVSRVDLIIDGTDVKNVPKASAHWIRYRYAAKEGELKKHSIQVKVFDHDNHLIQDEDRSAWTAQDNQFPNIEISSIKDEKGTAYFLLSLTDEKGKPIPEAAISWGVFDAFNWQEREGVIETGPNGNCLLRRLSLSKVQLVGARYDFQRGDFKKRITGLYVYSYR